MEDNLSLMGVIPSDRKKLENMGITRLEQIAIMSVGSLGMGNSKGNMLIQRARNILANKNIENIEIINEDLIEINVKDTSRAVIKSVLNALDVYSIGWGKASLKIKGNITGNPPIKKYTPVTNAEVSGGTLVVSIRILRTRLLRIE